MLNLIFSSNEIIHNQNYTVIGLEKNNVFHLLYIIQ